MEVLHTFCGMSRREHLKEVSWHSSCERAVWEEITAPSGMPLQHWSTNSRQVITTILHGLEPVVLTCCQMPLGRDAFLVIFSNTCDAWKQGIGSRTEDLKAYHPQSSWNGSLGKEYRTSDVIYSEESTMSGCGCFMTAAIYIMQPYDFAAINVKVEAGR